MKRCLLMSDTLQFVVKVHNCSPRQKSVNECPICFSLSSTCRTLNSHRNCRRAAKHSRDVRYALESLAKVHFRGSQSVSRRVGIAGGCDLLRRRNMFIAVHRPDSLRSARSDMSTRARIVMDLPLLVGVDKRWGLPIDQSGIYI